MIVALLTHAGMSPVLSDTLFVMSNVSTLGLMGYLMGVYQVGSQTGRHAGTKRPKAA